MQIRIDNFELTPLIRGHHPVFNLAVNGARLYQTATGLRADEVEHFYRNNRETVIVFGVLRQHPTLEEAAEFCLTHELNVPVKGMLTMTMNYGQRTIRRWLPNAIVTRIDSRMTGTSSTHVYEIRGGAMLTEQPTL